VLTWSIPAGINLNPYQGLKLLALPEWTTKKASRNQPKSLSGIETDYEIKQSPEPKAGINLNPYQGLKHCSIGI
jgi:hypothetical protein